MKKLFLIAFSIYAMTFFVVAYAQEVTVDEVIEKTLATMYPSEIVNTIKGTQYSAYIYDGEGNLRYYCTSSYGTDFSETNFYYGSKKKNMRLAYKDGEATYFVEGEQSDNAAITTGAQEYFARELAYELFPFYQHVQRESTRALLDAETVEGSECYVVEFTKSDDFKDTFYIDSSSFLIVKRVFESKKKEGKQISNRFYYDYKDVEGVQEPFLLKTFKQGKLASVSEVDSISYLMK